MKRIAITKRHFNTVGGLEKSTKRLLDAFQKLDCQVDLITYPYKHFSERQNIRNFDSYCSHYFRKNHYDVIFGMDRTRDQTHYRAGNGVHKAYLDLRKKNESYFKQLSFSINPLHRLMLKIEKQAFESVKLKALIVNSHLVKKQVLHYYSTDPKKIHVIHNGVEWAEKEKSFNLWPDVKKNSGSLQLLFAGQDYKRKGLTVLLDALSEIKRRDFNLSIVGADRNISYYKNYAYKKGLSEQTTFHGFQKDMNFFYQQADVLVIPSLYDPFANVTVESLAMGVRVLSSRLSGGYEVLSELNGQSFDTKEELAFLIEKSFDLPKTWQQSLEIRNSIKHLDYSIQLGKICNICLSDVF
jgi:UDP-glucose:(heptosyl)LPS alpha-1,3-glucosyltransferase